MKYSKKTLTNGLRVILAPMAETQTATVLVIVGTGSRYETEKEAGISHFLEHMFFKGTKKRPQTLDIAEELDAVGGEYNAFTGKEFTGYYAKVDARHLDVALDVVSDIFLNSKLDPAEIKKEKGAIIQEMNMYEDMPMRKIGETYEELLYKNSLGRDIAGYKKTVRAFKRLDFVKYMKKNYIAENTVVCVAGKFSEKKIREQLKKYFSQMKKGQKADYDKVTEKQNKPALKLKYKETEQTHLVLGVRAFSMFSEKRYPLSLMSVILGGNMSSRLFTEVRERRGLAYYIKTFSDLYQDAGYLASQAGIEHKNLAKTVAIILKEYQKIADKKISSKELNKAKEYLKGKTVMGLESSDSVASFLADQEILKNRILKPEEVFKKVDQVSEQDIQEVAQEIFKDKRLNLAVIGPHKNKRELEKIMNI